MVGIEWAGGLTFFNLGDGSDAWHVGDPWKSHDIGQYNDGEDAEHGSDERIRHDCGSRLSVLTG